MSKIDLNKLDSVQYDVLREIGNIGAGNATTALASMLDVRIDMNVPKVQLVGFDEITTFIGHEEDIMAGILLLLDGEINGMMMFILEIESARGLVDTLMQRKPDIEKAGSPDFDEMECSALNEIGNIITGAYLSALSDLTKLTISASVPSLQIDMACSILSVPAIEFGKIGDKVLLIETQFDPNCSMNGYFVLIPELDSYDKILSSLGI